MDHLLLVVSIALSCCSTGALSTGAEIARVAAAGGTNSVVQGLLDRVRRNDRAGKAARSARAFVVGDQTLGRVLPRSADVLSRFPSVFSVTDDAVTVIDRAEWGTKEDGVSGLVSYRSDAVRGALEEMRDRDMVPALRGWRDEPFAVRETFHSEPELIVERAAAVLFGAPAYGVFVNGYTREKGGGSGKGGSDITHVWAGRRSSDKATWPGRLDSLAAGGLAAGMLPCRAMWNECAEEAGISDELLAENLRAVSAVSYTGYNDDMWGLKRDVLFCFDLELPPEFNPVPIDGEMDGFDKLPVERLVQMLTAPVNEDDSDNEWKPNVGVVLIDFLVRHGAVDVDDPAFLELLSSLRGAKCT